MIFYEILGGHVVLIDDSGKKYAKAMQGDFDLLVWETQKRCRGFLSLKHDNESRDLSIHISASLSNSLLLQVASTTIW